MAATMQDTDVNGDTLTTHGWTGNLTGTMTYMSPSFKELMERPQRLNRRQRRALERKLRKQAWKMKNAKP